jgi:ribosomal protein S18 acetylase RimI-like enzyme
VIYRPYTPPDFDPLYSIEEASFEAASRFSRRYMRQLVSRSNAATWIAEESGKICGFAIVEWLRDLGGVSGYIQTIEVSPDQRRRGIGSELIRRVEASATAAKSESIRLHVDEENAAAIRLYESHGYSREGREEDYYPSGHAAWMYAKQLDAAE